MAFARRIFPDHLRGLYSLIAFTAFWWAAVDSFPLWKMAAGASFPAPLFIALGVGLVLLLEALLLLVSAFTGRRAFKALVSLLSVIGAGGFAFSVLYNAAMSPEMLRNAIETDMREAGELLSPALFGLIGFAVMPPLLAAWKAAIPNRGVKARASALGLAALCVLLGAGAVMTDFKDVSVFMREHKDARYFISPLNVMYSAASTTLRDQSAGAAKSRIPVDPSPALAAAAVNAKRPLIVAVVVGETARASSWGLSGYGRDTTPELRKEGVINFSDVTSCGSSTAVSLPCMMSRTGRADYDRDRILSEEPLPSLLSRAGASVAWIDNQSGCKGTCEGVPTVTPAKDLTAVGRARYCPAGECFDEALLPYVEKTEGAPGTVTTVFFHMMGSHGPTYSKRYPEGFAKWNPVCDSSNIQACRPEELKNAYDNSIAYTDRTVAAMIRALKAKTGADTALIYVSDHGESLGEKGLFLHGAPYAIAPDEQTKVPMVLWMSKSFEERLGIDAECVKAAAAKPVSHDSLWSTVIGLSQVETSAYEKKLDVIGACRRS